MSRAKTAHISTILSVQVKDALSKFCQKRGFKISRFIEEAILERLEDEVDVVSYETRRNEERVSLEDLLKNLS